MIPGVELLSLDWEEPLWRELLTAGVFQRILLIRNDCGVRSYEVKELECCGCLAEC